MCFEYKKIKIQNALKYLQYIFEIFLFQMIPVFEIIPVLSSTGENDGVSYIQGSK